MQDTKFMTNMKSAEQGASTAVWAALAPVWEGTGGKYLYNCAIGGPAVDCSQLNDEGHAPWAYDVEGENKLWKLSEELTGVTVDL